MEVWSRVSWYNMHIRNDSHITQVIKEFRNDSGTNSTILEPRSGGSLHFKSRRTVDAFGDDVVDNDVEGVSFLSPG